MAGPGGKEVGRVSVRVVPDTSKTREDLQKALDRIEKQVHLEVPLEINTRPATVTMQRFQKDWAKESIELDADVATKGATAHLKAFTRPRALTVKVGVELKAAKAKVAGFLAGISGIKASQDVVRGLDELLTDTISNLPKIGAMSVGVAGLAAGGINLAHGLGAVVVQLAQLVPLIALAPAFLVGAGLGVTALVVALKDAPKRLGATATAYKQLGPIISNNFWAKAIGPVKSLLTTFLPQLDTGFARLSSTLGSAFGGIAGSLNKALAGAGLKSLFSDAAKGLSAATPGLLAFTSAFSHLVVDGAAFLPQFGGWISKIGGEFSGWLSGVEASGQLDSMIQTAITLLSNVGGVLVGLGSILSGVFNAGGGDAVGALAAGLASVAAVVNSPAFQTTLATIFAGAASGASGLAAALAPIGSMLASLAPVLSQILSSSGAVLGTILGDIASALSQPAFQVGLSNFFAGIQAGLLAVGPSLPALASALGSLGTFAGALATQLGPILGSVLSGLAPVLSSILTAVQPLLPVLGSALIGVFQALAPVIQQVVTTLLPPLVGLISQLVPLLTPIITALLPIISALLPPIQAVISALLPILTPVLQLLTPIIQLIAAVLGPALQLITPLLNLLAPLFSALADTMKPIVPIISGVASFLGDILGPAVKLVTSVLNDLIKFLTDVFQGKWGDAWQDIQNLGKDAFNGLIDFGIGIVNGLVDLVNGLTGGINDVTAKVGIPAIPKIPHIPVPKLETGGDILGSPNGTLIIAGENNQDESVVNRGKLNRLLDIATSGPSATKAGPQKISGTLDLGNGLYGFVEGVIQDYDDDGTSTLLGGVR